MVPGQRAVARRDRVEDLDPASRRKKLRAEVDPRGVRRPRVAPRTHPTTMSGKKIRFATGQPPAAAASTRTRCRGARTGRCPPRAQPSRKTEAAQESATPRTPSSPRALRRATVATAKHGSRENSTCESIRDGDGQRPQERLPGRGAGRGDPDTELEEGDGEERGRGEAREQALGLARLEAPAEEQEQEGRKGECRQDVRRIAGRVASSPPARTRTRAS